MYASNMRTPPSECFYIQRISCVIHFSITIVRKSYRNAYNSIRIQKIRIVIPLCINFTRKAWESILYIIRINEDIRSDDLDWRNQRSTRSFRF